MQQQFAGFDWDEGNTGHCKRHGLSQTEIEHFFRQGNVLVAPDPLHAQQEERYLAVGRSRTGRPMLVVFTIRGADEPTLLRPISARYMHEKEARKYEEESSKI